MSVYHRGRRFYHEIAREYDPVNPYALGQPRLPQALAVTPEASLALVERVWPLVNKAVAGARQRDTGTSHRICNRTAHAH
jgi:hypothetical protein